MQSDDLFLRKMRGPSARPVLGVPSSSSSSSSPGGGPPQLQRSSSEANLGGCSGVGVTPGGDVPRARSNSHEQGGASPTPPRFRDPLLLLGLEGGSREGDGGQEGDPDFFPRPPWPPYVAHYDVQSLLFDPSEPPPAAPPAGSTTSGASAAHLEPDDPPLGDFGDPPDVAEETLVLSCPRFCCETGGEREPRLVAPHGPPGPFELPNAAVAVLEEPPPGTPPPHPIEHSDAGADYYRKYFYGKEHQNFLGEDARGGPVAVSLRREEKEGGQVLHRVILRTSQGSLRASVLEEALPPSARPPGARGVPPKKLLELLLPAGGAQGLRLAAPSPAVPDTLLKLDEQGLSFQRKVGVLYCRGGQGSEEEMYNNEAAAPPFAQFLALLGTTVRLRGFPHYRAQLDTRTDSTGTHSLYTTYHGYEVMFHVSTMLPFTPRNRQQLLRKRHIGNDIVTIVFQEPGARPFSPRALRSHFQHVFIVVRVHQPCTPRTSYSVAVVRPEETPLFGPGLRRGQRFAGGSGLREFLLAKAINGENAAALGGRLGAMAQRTRHQYLRELVATHAHGPPLAAPPRGLPLLGGRRRGASAAAPQKSGWAATGGALVWGARAKGAPGGEEVGCFLGVGGERVVVAAPRPPRVLFSCPCREVLGWVFGEGRLEIFYGAGEWVGLRLPPGAAPQVVARLQAMTRGCEARELALPRGAGGDPGFEVDAGGVVTSVTRFSFAETAGLRPGTRLLRVAHRPLPGLRPPRLRALLRRPPAPLTLLPPDRDGRPRRSFSELYARSLEQGRPGAGGDPGGAPPVWEGDDDSAAAGESGGSPPGKGAGGEGGASLRPDTLRLLRSLALDEESTPFPHEGGPPENPPDQPPSPQPLSDPTPDLLLPHRSPPPPGDPGAPLDAGAPPEAGPPLSPTLRHSLGRLFSAGGEPQEEEWETIARLATACSGILEALARGGQPPSAPQQSQATPEDESRSLSEKVSQLEAMLKRLQEDLQEGQEEQQRLRAEVRTLRRSNRRLRQEHEDAAARLSCVTRLLRGPPNAPGGASCPDTPPGGP